MTFCAIHADPRAVLPVFAKLYGGSEQDFAGTLPQITAAWSVQDSSGETVGAIGLRPSPAHGAEVMGGALPGPEQDNVALTLILAATAAQPQLYAYAEAHLLPARALQAAGLRPVSAYTQMTGPLPTLLPNVPDGFTIVPLLDVHNPQDRLLAQTTYSDRIGHTHVPDEAAQPGFLGSNEAIGRLAYDASGVPAGLCRAWMEGEQLALGTPGVRPDVRHTGLRRALLLSVFQAAREASATWLELDAWGDTAPERAADEALGLMANKGTPIYSSVPL